MEPFLQENKINPVSEVIMSMHYLPCIDFYALAIKHGTIIFEIHESFPKQTYRNRCYIYSANGLLTLSIPLIKKNNTPTKDIKIDYTNDWQIKHWRAIESAYSNTAFFLYFQDYFKDIFSKKEIYLKDWNNKLFETINKILKINLSYTFTTKFEKEILEKPDYRNHIHPKQKPLLSKYPLYFQPFAQKHGFIANLSIIDAIFNLGNEQTKNYIETLANFY